MNGEIVTLSHWLALLTGEMVHVAVETDGTVVFAVGPNRMRVEEARQLIAGMAGRDTSPQPQTLMCSE
jgi:hypothetical protein